MIIDFGYSYEYAQRIAYKKLLLTMVDSLIGTFLLIAALILGAGFLYMLGGIV